MNPADVLEHAAAQIRERAASRDTPNGERSMARAVNAFNELLGGDRRLTEAEGWLFMCCLKMARGTAGKANPDDAVDLAGYAALWGECYSASKPEPGTVIEVVDLIGGWHMWDFHQPQPDALAGPPVQTGFYIDKVKYPSGEVIEVKDRKFLWDASPLPEQRIVAYCLERLP